MSSDDPPLPSVVGYSQIIDASPTDLSVVCIRLVKSLQMADQIGQKDAIVVFDYAIHAKAVEMVSKKQGWIGYAGTHVPMFVHKLGLIKPRQT